jgi:hypothetical protein
MFELRDSMRFDLDDSIFCNSELKKTNQIEFKKFMNLLHHKGLSYED